MCDLIEWNILYGRSVARSDLLVLFISTYLFLPTVCIIFISLSYECTPAIYLGPLNYVPLLLL